MNRLTKVPFLADIMTNGSGFYSERVAAVRVTHLQVPYNAENKFGELCVYFDNQTWDTERDGLIYTDVKWLKELRLQLESAGYDSRDVSYPLSPGAVGACMQGDNYVSLDVGKKFLASWIKLNTMEHV